MQPFFMGNSKESRRIYRQRETTNAREKRLERAFGVYQDSRYLSPGTRLASVLRSEDSLPGENALAQQALNGHTITFDPKDKQIVPAFDDLPQDKSRTGGSPTIHPDGKIVLGIDLGRVDWGDADLNGRAVHTGRRGNKSGRH